MDGESELKIRWIGLFGAGSKLGDDNLLILPSDEAINQTYRGYCI
jgi:hypothetical protein